MENGEDLIIIHDLVYVTISERVREWQRVLINGTLNLATDKNGDWSLVQLR